MKESVRDKVEGTAHEVKGAIKEKVRQTTNNPDLQVEGSDEKTGGKIQNKVGEIEEVFNK